MNASIERAWSTRARPMAASALPDLKRPRRVIARLIFPLAGALIALAAASASAQQPDQLDRFVREAIRHNLSFQQKRLDHEKSETAVTQARGLFLPNVTLDARYSEINGGLDLGDLVKPDWLFVPTAKSTTSQPPLPGSFGVDHFKCYKISRFVKTRPCS